MVKKSAIPETVLAAATGMLQPFYPELSPARLVEALEEPARESKPKRHVSPREYAQMMGISRDTVIRLIHARKLEHARIGRQYRIPVNEESV